MSDTPKTDELAKREFVTDGVWIRHARELERENVALRADKQRLDWMASADYWADIAVYRTPQALRAAIDAARKEAHP